MASSQSLRQRYSRLSPLRLGIYALVSLGSHLLLLGLFRWAWQVQLATQPVGSPIGIDFVEVDLSDGSFAGQLPDESAEGALSGGKLSAAQLNELIAQGDSAPVDAPAEAEGSEVEPNEALQDREIASETVALGTGPGNSNTADENAAKPPQPDRVKQELPRSGLLRPPFLPSVTDNATAQPERDASTEATTDEAAESGGVGEATGAIADNNSNEATPASPGNSSPEQNSPSETTAAALGTDQSQNSDGGKSGGDAGNSSNSGGGTPSGSSGRPNTLPPNMSDQPVDPDQTVKPGETTLESGGGGAGDIANDDNGTSANQSGNETGDAVPRLGASLLVDEVQSRALNTQDVFTQLPRPLRDPLSSGSQSVNAGRCQSQLAAIPPASYGQPVQLRLAVDVNGEVFGVEGMGAQAQTAVGQAIACIAEAWPFEPAQRVINEGGVEKIEDAGAVLFVTVTISLQE